MIYSYIKNTSVQLATGPSQQVRLIQSASTTELPNLSDADVLSAKLTNSLVSSAGNEYDDTVIKADIASLKTGKVDVIAGKGLSEMNFSAALKTKLDGVSNLATRVTLVDNLTSTDKLQALTANQGKVLKDLIDALTARVTALEAAANP